jgi:hypothetical protein
MLQADRNPFRPGVGVKPLVLAGREPQIRTFQAVLRGAPEIPPNIRLTGLRGVGKTVLLSEFDHVAGQSGWATALLELRPDHNTDHDLTKALADAAQRTVQRVSRAAAVKEKVGSLVEAAATRIRMEYQDLALSFGPGAGDQDKALAESLFSATKASVDSARQGLLLLLDEAQVLRDERDRFGEHPLSVLLAAVSALQRETLPIGLVVCGLPTLTGNLLKARTYTERMFRGMDIGSLSHGDARDAFVGPLTEGGVHADDPLIDRVLAAVEGYPYFIQLWGAELWEARLIAGTDRLTVGLLESIQPAIYARLDLDFYEPRVQTLTPAEQDLLLAGGRCPYPPLRVSEVQPLTRKTPGNVNVLLGRLVEAGVLYRLRKGEYAYTAPKFYEYLQRRLGRIDEAQMSWTEATSASGTFSPRTVVGPSE